MVRVFAYGTLRRGEPNHRVIPTYALESVQPAIAAGLVMFQAAHAGFPYATIGAGQIVGDLITVYPDAWDDVVGRLDLIEGHPHHYRRTWRPVLLPDRTRQDAWVYLAAPGIELAGLMPVPDGDWTRRRP